VITESGGIPIPSASGPKLPIMVGEKGCYWSTITVRGTPGHGSQPWRTDNALVKAAEAVRRIADYAPATDINDVWRRFVAGIDIPDELARGLLSADDFMSTIEYLPLGIARQFHACTHTTFSPNIVHGGSKINTIPDTVELQVDIRTLPGQTAEDVEAQLREALGDLSDDVEFTASAYDAASASPIDTPLWDVLTRASARFYEDSTTVPMLIVGATDARFFRRLGATAYGYGLFSRNLSFADYSTMFHGDNERVDQESLQLSAQLWQAVAQDLLG
jgi:acetylornithine deacetylase/succinyl-diaminopimelate desuccinylase-like protein